MPPSDERDGAAAEERLERLMRMAEALVFASPEPVTAAALAERLPEDADVPALMAALEKRYRSRGIVLVAVAGGWSFRTAEDLAGLLHRERREVRRLSRAALETLAIVAYHQPVTRAEIEEIRGVATSKGTLDVLMETGWVRLRGRRATPGRPVTYGTTAAFLTHFGLPSLSDLPGVAELRGAGLLDPLPPGAIEAVGRGESDADAADGPDDDGAADGADAELDGEDA